MYSNYKPSYTDDYKKRDHHLTDRKYELKRDHRKSPPERYARKSRDRHEKDYRDKHRKEVDDRHWNDRDKRTRDPEYISNHHDRNEGRSQRSRLSIVDESINDSITEIPLVKSASSYKIDFNNRPTLFDLPPPGYQNTSVQEFKQLKASGALPVMAIPQGSNIILRSRRIYLENLPEDIDENEFISNLNLELRIRNIPVKPGNPALGLDMGLDRTTAYLEFRTSEEAVSALSIEQFRYRNNLVKFSKPADFQDASGYFYGCANVFQDTLNKLFVACIPVYLNDDQVRELLQAFGELKAFNLVKDGATGLSKGYAFCEYRDGAVTDIAISGLNNMQIADKKLVVQRAVLGSRAGTNLGGIIPTVMQVPEVDPDHIISHDLLVTNILCLINMAVDSELRDPKIVEEIRHDVLEECSKYGEVVSIEIPLPVDETVRNPLGKVFVQFSDRDHCKEAHENLAGRKFTDRLVLTSFYDSDKYHNKEF